MRIGSIIILMIILVGLLVGQAQYEQGEENISKITDELVWEYNYTIQSDVKEINRIENIIHKTLDWGGFSFFEITKGTVEYGYNNHNINYESLLYLIKWFIIIWIIVALLGQLPYIIAIFYVIGIGLQKAYKWINGGL
jgi:hypothetical protein